MGFGNKILTSIVSMYMLAGTSECSTGTKSNPVNIEPEKLESIIPENKALEIPSLLEVQKKAKKQISICLKTDDENSFTHTKVLESIKNPEDAVLEFPLSQLFQKYGNRSHPLTVRGIKKDFRALLGKDGIEDLSNRIPQKLSPRTEKITSDTKYETGDTLRFALINPDLKGAFPKYLSDQLKEEGFQNFSDLDLAKIAKKIENKNQNLKENTDKKRDFIYDIVIKKLPTGEGALAIYRDGELFMATYASVGLNSKKTIIGQHEIIKEDAYKRSITHNNAPMSFGLNFYKGEWTHQGDVTKHPESHGCVRQPGVYADVSYSLIYPVIKNKNRVDVFISNNLYK